RISECQQSRRLMWHSTTTCAALLALLLKPGINGARRRVADGILARQDLKRHASQGSGWKYDQMSDRRRVRFCDQMSLQRRQPLLGQKTCNLLPVLAGIR